MSFCCGASMIGTWGTMKHVRTLIHNVPILFCPVCHRVEIHYQAQMEYEILAEYAHGDRAFEVDFSDYVEGRDTAELFENCVNHEREEPADVVRCQIDMALDLMLVARWMNDVEWENELKRRLACLSRRRVKLRQKA